MSWTNKTNKTQEVKNCNLTLPNNNRAVLVRKLRGRCHEQIKQTNEKIKQTKLRRTRIASWHYLAVLVRKLKEQCHEQIKQTNEQIKQTKLRGQELQLNRDALVRQLQGQCHEQSRTGNTTKGTMSWTSKKITT